MDRKFSGASYATVVVADAQKGYAGLDLYRTIRDERALVASVRFWDGSGHFFLETFNTDVPVQVVEELLAEAKSTIRTS